jgi:glucose/arabinose dehydrogenase
MTMASGEARQLQTAVIVLLPLLFSVLAGCRSEAAPGPPTPTLTPSPSPTPVATPTPFPMPPQGSRDPSHLQAPEPDVLFTRGTLEGVGMSTPTSLAFGPDGRLYVAQLDGRIIAITLDGQRAAAMEVITTREELGDVLGIAFDPQDTTGPVTLYVSHSYVFKKDAPPFGGKVARLRGPEFDVADIITGLPSTSVEHATNGMAFDAEGRLYIAQAGTTNAGVPGFDLNRPETPFSSAILIADISAPGFDGAITYDTPGALDTTNVLSGDIEVFASGFRNPYDVVVHSSGQIYATDNGPNPGAGLRSTGCSSDGPTIWTADKLNLIIEGSHYGHPNRNRGRADPRQCVFTFASASGGGVTAPIATLGYSSSANGLAEYTADAFGGRLRGDLIYVEWLGARTWRVTLDENGYVEAIRRLVPDELEQPLDVAVGPDGTVYIAEFGANRITYFTPQP